MNNNQKITHDDLYEALTRLEVEDTPFPDNDDASILTLSDDEIDARWKRYANDTKGMNRERRMFIVACLIAGVVIGAIVWVATAMHSALSSNRERIAAAEELQAAFSARHIPLVVHAAGPECNVLLINSVDRQGRMAMLFDGDVESIFYGGGPWEAVPGGVNRYRRDHHFAGVLFVESEGDAWMAGTVAPGLSDQFGVGKLRAEEKALVGRMEECR